MRVPPVQRSLTAFSLEVCGRQQEQVLLKGCLSTELKEIRGSERVVWLQCPSQRASSTICNTRMQQSKESRHHMLTRVIPKGLGAVRALE